MGIGNVLATASTLLTSASDILTGETNITGALTVSDNGIGSSHTSSIGRDTLTSSVTCGMGWISPIGLTSAPLAAIPFANDLGILYTGPLSKVPQSIKSSNIDIKLEWGDKRYNE